MTMSCEHVPENEFLFTQVQYGDPSLAITQYVQRIASPLHRVRTIVGFHYLMRAVSSLAGKK